MVNGTRRRSYMEPTRPSPPAKAPRFFKIITSSIVQHQKLRIPSKFVSKYGKNLRNHVFLKVPSGAVWKVGVIKSNDNVWLYNGWKEFAECYKIGYGHFLVFRYDGNSNFHVLIFDMTASEIAYPVSTSHAGLNNFNINESSQVPCTEDIDADDSVEILEDFPTHQTEKVEIHESNEFDNDVSVEILGGSPTYLKIRKPASYRADIDEDVSIEILDDPPLPDFPSSERKRNNTCKKENNSNMHSFSPDFPIRRIQTRGLKHQNLKKEVKPEIGKEYIGGASMGQRHQQSQIPIKKQSTTANREPTALERAGHFKSKKPFFTVYMRPSYVSPEYGLNIPVDFAKKHLCGEQKSVILKVSDGRTWSVRCYSTSRFRRTLGWGSFARDNNLGVSDACVFELIKGGVEPWLNVMIFRAAD